MKFFQKYLSVWVILCMIIGVSIGHFFPMIPNILNKFEYAGISIPMAVLIWIMIYPMMIKVDFKSVKYISKNPKGLFVTWIVNWLIKPFTMYGIACLFFFGLFRAFIPVELATEYLAGAVLLGAAPCTAMVFVWSTIDISADIYVSVGSYSEKSYTHNTDCNTFDNSDIFDLWNRIRSVLSIKTATQYCSTCRNNRSI